MERDTKVQTVSGILELLCIIKANGNSSTGNIADIWMLLLRMEEWDLVRR